MNKEQRKNLNQELKNFILTHTSESLARASMGWIYALSHDKAFLVENFEFQEPKKRRSKKNTKELKQKKPKLNVDLFEKLQCLVTSKERWEFIKEINSMRNFGGLEDSFQNETNKKTFELARKFISSNQKLNILVMGAGCCGLFFSNTLKKKLGKLVNILVCDNRVQESGIRKPYSRNWLTNLRKSLFNTKVDKSISDVFDWFSNGEHIGVTLNMMEILLLQSCKKNKVKFLFKDDLYDDLINKSGIDLIIDATGGEIYKYYPNHEEKNILLKVPIDKNKNDYLSFNLKDKNNCYFPYFLNKQVKNYQFKIIGIPEKLYPLIIQYVNENNYDNLFYVWTGKLIKELNEILIIINIKEENLEIFYDLLKKRTCIDKFEQFDEKVKKKIDNRILKLINIILKVKTKKNKIYLEPPFSYTPRVKLFYKDIPKYNDKIIIPIGDSYYTGNAKVGNGLGTHLLYIDELTETIANCFGKIF